MRRATVAALAGAVLLVVLLPRPGGGVRPTPRLAPPAANPI